MVSIRFVTATLAVLMLALSAVPALGQEEPEGKKAGELDRLEAAWTTYRSRAQLQEHQLEKLLKSEGFDRATFDLVLDAEREWWLQLQRRFREVDLEWKLAKARLGHLSNSGGSGGEEVAELRRELVRARGELERGMKTMGHAQPRMLELKEEVALLEEELLAAVSRGKEDLRHEVGSLEAVRKVLDAELEGATQRVRELGSLERQVAAHRTQIERYKAEADRLFQLWERLQSK